MDELLVQLLESLVKDQRETSDALAGFAVGFSVLHKRLELLDERLRALEERLS
jgi:hypothetical protein